MADPTFPVDPLPPATTPEPTSEIPHDDVHAALADALGVDGGAVKTDAPADPNDAPLNRPFSEILAERKAKLDNATLPRDPSVTPRTGDTITPPEFWPAQGSPSALASSNPNAVSGISGGDKPPGWMANILAQASAEQEQASLPGIEGGAASPGPGPFAARAAISQPLKRLLRSSVLVEIEGEGLDQLAQIVARILTTQDAANARAAWNELGRLCDDVAAALR